MRFGLRARLRRTASRLMLLAMVAFVQQGTMIAASQAQASVGSMIDPAVTLRGSVHYHNSLARHVHTHGYGSFRHVHNTADTDHNGDDNDAATRSAMPSSTYPRVTAQSELYEIVGILRGERLSIYLDHLATNESVSDAKIKVAIADTEPVDAEPTENGIYTISFPRLARTGSVEVVFSITAPSGDDLLVGSLTRASSTEPSNAAAPPMVSLWIASAPWPIRHPIVLILVTFGLGVLFGHFHRNGRVVPAMATGAAAAGVLVILGVVALSANNDDRSGSSAQTPADTAMRDAPRRLPDGTAFVAKPTQRLLEVRTTT